MNVKYLYEHDITNYKVNIYEIRRNIRNLRDKSESIAEESNNFKELSIDKYLICEDNFNFIPLIYKVDNNGIKFLHKNRPHVISLYSIIKNIIFNDFKDLNFRLELSVYMLYNIWLYKKNDICDIVICVCIDIEDIISILINKSDTVYRAYNTMEPVEKLRKILKREKMYQLGVSL